MIGGMVQRIVQLGREQENKTCISPSYVVLEMLQYGHGSGVKLYRGVKMVANAIYVRYLSDIFV